jgi:hypothetical protein
MAITKWSIQAPSSKKSPAEAAAAALRKKSPAEAGPSVRVVSLRKEGLWVFRSGTMRQFGPRGLVPWRQTLGARVLPRSNRRRVGHVQSSQRKLIERRIIAKAVLGVEKAPPLWESGAFRVMPLAEGFPSSAAGQFGDAGIRFRLARKESPAEAGQGPSWKENQDEATATITKIAAVLRLEGSVVRTRSGIRTKKHSRRRQARHSRLDLRRISRR